MANARKCDRCGNFFDPLNMKGMTCRFLNPIFQSSNDIREGVVGKLMFSQAEPDDYIDLCPQCSEAFEAFMCTVDPPEEKSKEDYEFIKKEFCENLNRKYSDLLKGISWFNFNANNRSVGDTDGDEKIRKCDSDEQEE